MSIFYVYEHWRPDKDVCFYVGKGSKGRARTFIGGIRTRDQPSVFGQCPATSGLPMDTKSNNRPLC